MPGGLADQVVAVRTGVSKLASETGSVAAVVCERTAVAPPLVIAVSPLNVVAAGTLLKMTMNGPPAGPTTVTLPLSEEALNQGLTMVFRCAWTCAAVGDAPAA